MAPRTIVLATQGAITVLFVIMMLGYNWEVYLMFYLPICVVRAACGSFVGTRVQYSLRADWDGNVGGLFSSRQFPTVAPYLQACTWTVVFVILLGVRPLYFYTSQTNANSPCGQSSCTSDAQTFAATAIYNPHGFFPVGFYNEFDRTGLTEYGFCYYKNAEGESTCRWADAIKGNDEKIKNKNGITLGNGGTNGMPSTSKQDYKNILGWGIVGGVRDRTVQAGECPGAGDEVCTTCSLYDNTYLAAVGFPSQNIGISSCARKPDGSVDPLCIICPSDTEDADPDTVLTILWLHAALLGEVVVAAVLVVRDVYSIDSEMYEEVPEDEDEAEDDKKEGGEDEDDDDEDEDDEDKNTPAPSAPPLSMMSLRESIL